VLLLFCVEVHPFPSPTATPLLIYALFCFVQVVAIGFDPRMAKIALQHHQGNVDKAVEELVKCGGFIDGEHCTDGKLCRFPYVLF
jgi:hypothetical protein